MVKGLDIFRLHFQKYTNRYLLIGGTACDIAMTRAGLEFRATKDLDIVLVAEALDAEFVIAFWDFVRLGGYQIKEKSTGQKQFYRFQKPTHEAYPSMLELFSRQPDLLHITEGSRLTPIPLEEDLSSLSAILMDEDYYHFILAGRQEIEGVSVVDVAHLIPLKVRAWLDLTNRQQAGQQIDSRSIKKHKNDIFRLYQILDPTIDPGAPLIVKGHLRELIRNMNDEVVDLKSLGIHTESLQSVLSRLAEIYRLG